MRAVFLATVLFALFSNACTGLWKDQSKQDEAPKQQETACAARYIPVGNNPEIALDTQTGTLCRTIADTNDNAISRMIHDPDFLRAAPEEQQKALAAHDPIFTKADLGEIKKFLDARKNGDKTPSPYASLPKCSEVIVVSKEDMRKYNPSTGKLEKY